MAEWEEVRRLAADFQRIQAASTVHRLSERNCIELVNKLLSMGLAEVLYTLDGKEYVTPHHLEREIRDELTVHRGRINVVDLQQILNVDFSHIEARVADLLKHDRSLILLNGELIDRSYIHRLCEEINDTLQEAGQVSIADLSRKFGLPNDFLTEHIESSLGTRIKGQLDKTDSGIIYTDAYVSRYHARVRGLFSAITRPTPMGPIISQGGFQEKLFNAVLHEMISSGQLRGSLHRGLDKAVYIPLVYTEMQNRWADSFLTANGYLEYDALSRLGIEDPRGYIGSRYGNRTDSEAVLQLVSCCVGSSVWTEVEGVIEEVQASGGWADILPILPSPCTPGDAALMLQETCKDNQDLRLFGSVVTTKAFLQSCFQVFQPLLKEKAQKAVNANPALLAEANSRAAEQETASQKKRKGGSAGGGGRERKGGKGRRREVEEVESGRTGGRWDHVFMPPKEISHILSEQFPDCPEELIDNIAKELQSPLQDAFREEIRICVATVGQGPSAGQQRKRHANLQERVQGLWNSTRLFEKALALFEGDTEVQLSRYLLRTLCSDLTTMVLGYLAEDTSVDTPTQGEMTAKERSTVIYNLPEQMKRTLTAVNSSLNGKDVGSFFQLFEALCSEEYCGLLLKKPDRKKERQIVFSHQQSLLDSLREEHEPAMVLHLVAVLLFQRHTNCIIHAPGKLVPSIIFFLSSRLSESERSKLRTFQDLVMLQLKQSRDPSSSPLAGGKADPDLQNTSKAEETQAETEAQPITKAVSEGQLTGGSAEDSEQSEAGVSTSEMMQQEKSNPELIDQQLSDQMSSLKQLVLKPARGGNE